MNLSSSFWPACFDFLKHEMSVIWDSPEGSVVCHEKYLQNLYRSSLKEKEFVKFSPHEHLFLVKTPYMKDAEARSKVKEDSHPRPLKRKFDQLSASSVKDSKVLDYHLKFLVSSIFSIL